MTVSLVACLCLDKVNVTLRNGSCDGYGSLLRRQTRQEAWLHGSYSFLLSSFSLGHLVEVGYDVQFAVCVPAGLILEELGT